MARKKITKAGLIRLLLADLFIITGMILFWMTYAGYFYMGPAGTDFLIQRAIFFVGIGLCSSPALLVSEGSDKKTRFLFFTILFIMLTLFFFLVGAYNGTQFNALMGEDTVESYDGTRIWWAFDVHTSAVADLTVGLNIKLIADSITYFVPSFTLFIIVVQILYAGEGAFIPAVIEAFVLLLIIAIYNFIGWFQMGNVTVLTLIPTTVDVISNLIRNSTMNHSPPKSITLPILTCS